MGDKGQGFLDIPDDVETAPGHATVTLQAEITYADNTTEAPPPQLFENIPYFLEWQSVSGNFHGQAGNAGKLIKSVKLKAIVTGNDIEVFLDNIYARRAQVSFTNLPPAIQSMSATPEAVALPAGNTTPGTIMPVALSATATDPEGDTLTGSWFSDLEGPLGDGFTRQVTLTKPGLHHITFTAQDPFGSKADQDITVDVFTPILTLTTSVPQFSSVSGDVTFNLQLTRDPAKQDGTTTLPPEFSFVNGVLYADDHHQLETFTPASTSVTVDTRRLPDGIAGFQAALDLTRIQGPALTQPILVNSNQFFLTLNNHSGPNELEVKITSPESGSLLVDPTPIEVAVTLPTGVTVTRLAVGMYNQSRTYLPLGELTSLPYTLSFNPQSFPAGDYQIVATAYCRLPDTTIIDVRSSPVLVTLSPINPPANLTANALSPSAAELRWEDTNDRQARYELLRKTGEAGAYASIKLFSPRRNPEMSYSDLTLSPGLKYYYKVRAIKISNPSITQESEEVCVATPLKKPEGLALLGITQSGARIRWLDYNNNETGFIIERRRIRDGLSGDFIKVGQTSANVQVFIDTTFEGSVANNDRFLYRVVAINGCAVSLPSSPLVVSTAPTDLQASQAGSSVSLTWKDNTIDETGFVIERKAENESSFVALPNGSIGPNRTSFYDSTVQGNIRYDYRVYAVKVNAATFENERTGYSNIASCRLGVVPSVPAMQISAE
jgi:hypothetical protein